MKLNKIRVFNVVFNPTKGRMGQWFGTLEKSGIQVLLFSEEKRLMSNSNSILNMKYTKANFPKGKTLYMDKTEEELIKGR